MRVLSLGMAGKVIPGQSNSTPRTVSAESSETPNSAAWLMTEILPPSGHFARQQRLGDQGVRRQGVSAESSENRCRRPVVSPGTSRLVPRFEHSQTSVISTLTPPCPMTRLAWRNGAPSTSPSCSSPARSNRTRSSPADDQLSVLVHLASSPGLSTHRRASSRP
jgi:hypothetical protein